MGNTVHNAIVKTFAEGTFPGCVGLCYIQPDQMNYVPLEVSMAASLSAPNSQSEASNSQASTQATTATSTAPTAAIYSTPKPAPTVYSCAGRICIWISKRMESGDCVWYAI